VKRTVEKQKHVRPSSRNRRKHRSRQRSEVLQRGMREPLSRRELQVLIALGEGKTTPEIALRLKISGKTVAAYMQRLKEKLELANINELIRAAALLGEGIMPTSPNAGRNGSLRICPRCRRLFSEKPAKEDLRALAGYKVLSAVLKT
jgi:DNA-binding CsgD family transcriptional regulator